MVTCKSRLTEIFPRIKAACLHLNRRSVFLFCLLVDQEYMKNQSQRTKLKRNNTYIKGQRTKENKKKIEDQIEKKKKLELNVEIEKKNCHKRVN
jgi:hypothetical protein